MADEEQHKSSSVGLGREDLPPDVEVARSFLGRALLRDSVSCTIELSLDQSVVRRKPSKTNKVEAGLLKVASKEEVSRRLGDEEGADRPNAQRNELEQRGSPPLLFGVEVLVDTIEDPAKGEGVTRSAGVCCRTRRRRHAPETKNDSELLTGRVHHDDHSSDTLRGDLGKVHGSDDLREGVKRGGRQSKRNAEDEEGYGAPSFLQYQSRR